MAAVWRYLKRDCPVCNGARKDCRENTHTGLIHCRYDEVSSVPGLKFTGLDALGFNMWAPDDWREGWKEAEWERVRLAKRKRQSSEPQLSRLSIQERDRQFRSVLLLKVTTLSIRHSSHLQLERQLIPDEINWLMASGWVRTWEPGLYAPVSVTAELPGIFPDGKLLGMQGIAIAALDPDFHITGMQIATLLCDPKYIWLSGANHGGNGPQLLSGELPLFCWKHPEQEKVSKIMLCEGALKSLLTALFLWRLGLTNIAVIGTASAARYGEKTLCDYLKRLGAKDIQLMPDAGAIANPHITRAHQETLDLCRKWGYQVKVGDWGQLSTKEHLDIDELLAAGRHNEIKLLSSAAFLSQCHHETLIHKLLKSGEFHQIAPHQVELRPKPDSIYLLHQIQRYYQSIQTFRQRDYEVIVAWEGSTLRPEDFFALCPESIQQQLAKSQREWGILYNLKLWLKRMVAARPKKGFGVSRQSRAQTTPYSEVIKYKPGKLPQFGEYERPPKILFEKGQRLQVYSEAIAAGWKHILDTSPTGTFKSHDAGKAIPEALGVQQLWYFTSTARNITTNTVERNYAYLDVRNDGLKWDYTPSGKPYLRWPRVEETPDTPGNCHRTKVFAQLRDKNIPKIEGLENPVCATCHLLEACRASSGAGFGHRHDRRETLKCSRIRANPDSAPNPDDYDWGDCGNFWDEVMLTVQPISSVVARLADLDRVMAEFTILSPELNVHLQPLWAILRRLLTGEIKPPHHGWNDAAVRKMLPELPDNLDDLIAIATEILHPDLRKVLNTTSDYGVDLANLPAKMRKRFGNKTYDILEKIQQDITVNWFVPFLQVWGQLCKGALRIDNGKLTITTRNFRHAALAKDSAWNIYLDATATAEYLSWWMDVNPCEILTIEQEVTNHKNLQIIQVTGLGQVCKTRSDFCQGRVDALRSELVIRHPDIKFIDFVQRCQPGDGGWFRDSRGSNDFKDLSALATFGIPYQNIGNLEVLYMTLTGRTIADEDEPTREFQGFVDWATQAEIKQAIGRLRSHNRPDNKLYFYFSADYDLSFLGLPVEKIEAFNITPAAGTATQQTRWKIQEAVRQLTEGGQGLAKLRQQTVAKVTGLTQGRISQIASEFGGWKALKKILAVLLSIPYSTAKDSKDASEQFTDSELEWMSKTYLPLVINEEDSVKVVSEVVQIISVCDFKQFQRILIMMPLPSQAKLLACILVVLPDWLRLWFLDNFKAVCCLEI